jgi:hypothetical protein
MLLHLSANSVPAHLRASMRRIADELEVHGFHVKITHPTTCKGLGITPDPSQVVFTVVWHKHIWHNETLDAGWVEYIISGLHPTRALQTHRGTYFIVNDNTADVPVQE